MKKYIMLHNNEIIGIIPYTENVPNWGPNIDGDSIIAYICENDNVELGMMYDPLSGTYAFPIDKDPEPGIEPEPILVENEIIMSKLTNIEFMMVEDKQVAINEAIDNYTALLMEEGVL